MLWLGEAEKPPSLQTAGWQHGDIIFRRGVGIEAAVVRTTDRSGYTHAGILVSKEGRWRVIHVEPRTDEQGGKVESIPVEDFAAPGRATLIGVFSIPDASTRQKEAATTYAMEAAIQQVPFDSAFKYSDDASLYCTEIITKAYSVAGLSVADWKLAYRGRWAEEPILTLDALLQSGALRPVTKQQIEN